MNLPLPTQTTFTQALDTLTNLMSLYSTDIDVKKGSVVRLLLIRPYAYIYAKLLELLNSWIKRTSVAYLSTTDDTSDSIADLVASNYFISRRQGTKAKGLITLTCNTPLVLINRGTRFSIGDRFFITLKAYIGTSAPDIDSDDISYVPVFLIADKYKINIPVVALEVLVILIPAGVLVEIISYIAGVTGALILSPITGGADTLTNASMMQRCKQRCGSAIGTLQAIRTKMQDAPVLVISCGACASGDPSCFRDRYNNLAIPMGGAVDVYVKTLNQYAVKLIIISNSDLSINSNSQTYFEIVPSIYPDVASAIRIQSIVPLTGARLGKYIILYMHNLRQYTSAQHHILDIGARCTSNQKIRVTFNKKLPNTITKLQVALQYMPNIKVLQLFINASYGAYLGQNCLIKAAIPVTLSLKCQLRSSRALEDTLIEQIKNFIAARINEKEVGDYNLNMDQIALKFEKAYPDLNLRLPYTVSASLPMTNGGLYTFSTTDGTVSLLYRLDSYFWAAQAYFFSLTPNNISLLVVS